MDLTDRGCPKLALVSKERIRENDTMKTDKKNQNMAELNVNRQCNSEVLRGRCLNLTDQNEGNWHKEQNA